MSNNKNNNPSVFIKEGKKWRTILWALVLLVGANLVILSSLLIFMFNENLWIIGLIAGLLLLIGLGISITLSKIKDKNDSFSEIRKTYLRSLKSTSRDFRKKIWKSFSKHERGSLKHELFEAKQALDIQYLDQMNDASNNKFYMLSIQTFNKIGFKFRSFNYWFSNFTYNHYVNKKKIFTVSMAGETRSKFLAMTAVRALFLMFMVLIVVFPFYWMLSISFRSNAEISDGIKGTLPIWPTEWVTDAYEFLFNNPDVKIDVTRYIGNSFLIAVISTITQISVSLVAGFGLSHYNSRGKELLIIVILATMMLPGEALLIGQYIFSTQIQITNTLFALFVPFIGNAFTIFMFKNAFDGVNGSIKAAAKVDGVSTFKFFWKVAMPLIRSTIFTAGLMAFIASWNSVLWPTMVLKPDSEWMTLPMLLWQIMESSSDPTSIWKQADLADPQNLKMAGSIIAIVPMFVLFLLTKKYLVKGITKDSGAKE
ncbi:carbohydrate ABC transporter permease [Mesoplasma photuris]|uniref:carbohydrate ABC transporter permease n=1 Tax=Mesoplasma photuris TaxID=217731 RepID=UPI0004E1C429|nr:carbohydrate ABC transporter permease [Mesoplasma photuris]